jgi:hypothetical protein
MLGCDWIRPTERGMVEERSEEKYRENGRIRIRKRR